MKKKTAIIIGLTVLLVVLSTLLLKLNNTSKNKTIMEKILNDKRTNVVCNYYVTGYEKSIVFFEEDGKLSEAAVVDRFYSLLDKDEIEKNLNRNYEALEEIVREYVSFEFEYDDEIKKSTMVTRYDLKDMPIEFYSVLNIEKLLSNKLDFEETVNAYKKSHISQVCIDSNFDK